MKKLACVLAVVLCILVVCGFAFGEKKKNIPTPNKAVVVPARPPTMPMVRDIAMDDIFTDAQCRLWVRWVNKGTVRIDKVMRENVSVYGGGSKSDLIHVVLAPGAGFAHGFGDAPGFIISGAATVVATIDAENVLSEADEGNNSMAKTVPCGSAKPDLMPTYIDCLGQQTYVDAQNHSCKIFKVRVTIKNFGNQNITTPFQVLVERDSGANLSYVPMGAAYNVPSLAAGDELVLAPQYQADSCWWYLHNPGESQISMRIRVTVDSGNAISESLEDNNQTVHLCGGM